MSEIILDILDSVKVVCIETEPSDHFEDKYGYFAILKDLSEKYRCKCGDFFEYKDSSCEVLRCPRCGFEKPAPQKSD